MKHRLVLIASAQSGGHFFGELWTTANEHIIKINGLSIEPARLEGYINVTFLIAPTTWIPPEAHVAMKRCTNSNIIYL